jgi:hypothetical protein
MDIRESKAKRLAGITNVHIRKSLDVATVEEQATG